MTQTFFQISNQEAEKKSYAADCDIILIKENVNLPFIVLSLYVSLPCFIYSVIERWYNC